MAENHASIEHPLQPVFRAYDEGRAALLLTGLSLHDLDVDPLDGKIRPLVEMLRRELRRRYGMVYVAYSLAGGLDWDRVRIDDPADERAIENTLRSNGLLDIPRDRNEFVRVITGVRHMARVNHEAIRWADGRPMRFGFHMLFGEHLAPRSSGTGPRTEAHLAAIELATLTAQSPALRSSRNLVIFSAREGLMDDLVTGALHHIHLPQREAEEKAWFARAVLDMLDGVKLEEGLDVDAIARLTRNTPNARLEAVLRASRNTGDPVTARDLARERANAVEMLSESTLCVMDSSGAGRAELMGRNAEVPQRVLRQVAKALRSGNPATPSSLILCGPPGTGKSELASMTAAIAGVPAFRMGNPKGGIVGETERKARLQQRLLIEWSPSIAFCDEITEAMPLERSEFNGDSGATPAWSAEILSALGSEDRRGRSLLIGATNCPWRIGAAMRSRLEFVPVFFPLEDDYPTIIEAIVRRFVPGATLEANNAQVRDAAQIFHRKGAGPREMVKALNRVLLRCGTLGPQEILHAAVDETGAIDLRSVEYADLWALALTSSRSYLPWSDNPASFPFPAHFRNVVDAATGEIDRGALDAAIERLKPYANV